MLTMFAVELLGYDMFAGSGQGVMKNGIIYYNT